MGVIWKTLIIMLAWLAVAIVAAFLTLLVIKLPTSAQIGLALLLMLVTSFAIAREWR